MQSINVDFNGNLSDSDRYDITINSLIEVIKEKDKNKSKIISDICNETIVQILSDSFLHGDELKYIKKRIEHLLNASEEDGEKRFLSIIKRKIELFYSKQNFKGLSE
ncbi:MAG: hypothetical protein EOM55_00115 [Clostridia bacterium]|nr:hypothetical protein [Clostridia bacterium]